MQNEFVTYDALRKSFSKYKKVEQKELEYRTALSTARGQNFFGYITGFLAGYNALLTYQAYFDGNQETNVTLPLALTIGLGYWAFSNFSNKKKQLEKANNLEKEIKELKATEEYRNIVDINEELSLENIVNDE